MTNNANNNATPFTKEQIADALAGVKRTMEKMAPLIPGIIADAIAKNEQPIKPNAPVNGADLKTWTIEQLTFAAPFWISRLENQMVSDRELIAMTPAGTQLRLDALKIHNKTIEQLSFWKLVLSDRIRVIPPSLRTFHRNGSVATHRGTPAKRHTTVGAWDKTLGIWN